MNCLCTLALLLVTRVLNEFLSGSSLYMPLKGGDLVYLHQISILYLYLLKQGAHLRRRPRLRGTKTMTMGGKRLTIVRKR